MKKINNFYTIAKNIAALFVAAVFILISFFLFSSSISSTYVMTAEGPMQECVKYYSDFVLYNILILLLSFVLLYLFILVTKKVKDIYFTCGMLIITFLVGTLWCIASSTVPLHDQLYVTKGGMFAANGDYSYIKNDYFSRHFPFQLGYVAFNELFTRLFNLEEGMYVPLQIINVLLLCLAFYCLVKIIDLAFNSSNIHKLTCVLLAFSASPMLFCTFLYGNIPGLAFALLSVYSLGLLFKKNQKRYIFISAISIGISIALKLNCAIFLVAEIIMIFLNLNVSPKNLLKRISCIILSVICAASISSGIKTMYEKRADIEIEDGIPMLSWAAMGLNDNFIEAGWYDGKYTIINLQNNNYDIDKAQDSSLEIIKERLSFFKNNPNDAIDFFKRKTLSQWNETSFQSIWVNEVRLSDTVSNTAEFIIFEKCDTITNYLNSYATLIYAGLFISAILFVKNKNNMQMLLFVVIIGGFLYHAIFEAKSQYVLPYFILSIPLAAYGISTLFDKIQALYQHKKAEF